MGVLGDLKREKEDAAEYGLLTDFDRAPLKPIVLPPVEEFVSEIPQVADAEPPDEFNIDGPEFVEQLQASPAKATEDKLLDQLEAQGYSIEIWQVGKNYCGIVKFCAGRSERLFGDNLSAMRLALNAIGANGVTKADLDAYSGEEPVSNENPAVDFRRFQ